jgi:hypothetical protein
MQKGLHFPADKSRCLSDVFAPNGELFRSFDSHLDPPAGPAQQRDLDRTICKQLCHGHVRVHPVGGLNNY